MLHLGFILWRLRHRSIVTLYTAKGSVNTCCSVLPISRGHLSHNNSRKPVVRARVGRLSRVLSLAETVPLKLVYCVRYCIKLIVPRYMESLRYWKIVLQIQFMSYYRLFNASSMWIESGSHLNWQIFWSRICPPNCLAERKNMYGHSSACPMNKNIS